MASGNNLINFVSPVTPPTGANGSGSLSGPFGRLLWTGFRTAAARISNDRAVTIRTVNPTQFFM